MNQLLLFSVIVAFLSLSCFVEGNFVVLTCNFCLAKKQLSCEAGYGQIGRNSEMSIMWVCFIV